MTKSASYTNVQKLWLVGYRNLDQPNVVFSKALFDMFPLAKTIVKGALLRDECRGAHYKPEFAFPSLKATDHEGRRKEANQWCNAFEDNNQKWLKSTIAEYDGEHPQISYENVDVSLIPPRPRLYGLVGGEVIEQVWKERIPRQNYGGFMRLMRLFDTLVFKSS